MFWKKVMNMKWSQRDMPSQTQDMKILDEPFHRCMVCGITDKTHPDMDFRYCSECEGTPGYCTEHVWNHEHIKKDKGTLS